MVGGVRDGEEAVVAQPVGEEVVEDAAVVLAQHGVLRAVLGDLRDVVGQDALQERLRVRPVVSISPMWLTSKIPALAAHRRCSSLMPAYCTGISHPANGTSRAPAATWRS